jgi:hypothetical protein
VQLIRSCLAHCLMNHILRQYNRNIK